MAVYIEMPKLSDTMTEGTLVKWRKKKGDKVEAGDVLAEVETDKATMEMEAFDDGILTEVYVEEGQKVGVGQRMALLLAPGEKAPEGGSPGEAKQTKKSAEPTKAEQREAAPAPAGAPSGKAAPAQPSPAGERAEPAAPEGEAGKFKASPLAKKIAREKGVD